MARIEGRRFRQAVPWFLQENPSLSCPKAGKATYQKAIRLEGISSNNDNNKNGSGSAPEFRVRASAFFTFHSVLRRSKDFTESMRWVADRVATRHKFFLLVFLHL